MEATQKSSAREAIEYYVQSGTETALKVAEKFGVDMPYFWAEYKLYMGTIQTQKI